MQGLKSFLLLLEKNLNCAGLCTKSSFYVFRNVIDSPPKQKCQQILADTIAKNKNSFGGFCIFYGLYSLMIVSCCGYIVWTADKENEDEMWKVDYIKNKWTSVTKRGENENKY